MPKRTPSGRVRRARKERRPLAPIQERTSAGADSATSARERAEATLPARVGASTTAPRQSLLAGVRRPTRSSAPTLITDYAYVISDLRRIGILAGAAFALLIALTLVIR